MASKCTKCGNTDNYNFALNIGLCNPCISKRITELETERTRYRNCLEFLVVSHANSRVKMECIKRALKGKRICQNTKTSKN